MLGAMLPLVLALAVAPPAAGPVRQAEHLAAQALALAEREPAAALATARKALQLTARFQPTQFAEAGRRGEVVDDVFLAARAEYRRHRAPIYEAMGAALLAGKRTGAGVRYLRRALALEPTADRATRLAGGLVALGRGREALQVIGVHAGRGALTPTLAGILEKAVDAEGLPSAQVEIDRARLRALTPAPALRDGPLGLPGGARSSTGGPLRVEDALTVFYLAGRSCRACSEQLQAVRRAVPAEVRVVVVPEVPDEDQALRQVLQLYRHPFPVGLGPGLAAALKLAEGEVLVAGRRGWIAAGVAPPYAALPDVVRALLRSDVTETVPRAAWNRRPVERAAAAPAASRPEPLPEGLVPGDDEPAPPEWRALVEAFRAGRAVDALASLDALASREDAWLLPPEQRLNRAVIQARMGRRAEARDVLLRIGDTAAADAADRALEAIGR